MRIRQYANIRRNLLYNKPIEGIGKWHIPAFGHIKRHHLYGQYYCDKYHHHVQLELHIGDYHIA